jgi:hypothetical protein
LEEHTADIFRVEDYGRQGSERVVFLVASLPVSAPKMKAIHSSERSVTVYKTAHLRR